MRILVTGGTGFVGRHLTKRLIAEGHELTVTSTGSEPVQNGVSKVLYTGLEGIDWRFVKNQDTVIHLMANNDTLCRDRDEMFAANFEGPLRLFHVASSGGRCKRFIFASSTAVYGAEPAPYIEDKTKINPLNIYGDSKAAFEKFAERFAEEMQVTVIGLRYCNIYGPGEEQKGRRMSMVGQLLRKVHNLEIPVLFESGEQKRDWVYVDDVVEANVLALTADLPKKYNIYNIGSGTAHTFNEVIETINDQMRSRGLMAMAPVYTPCPFPESYQNHTECDITKAKRELGYDPQFSLRSGISSYYEQLIKTCDPS